MKFLLKYSGVLTLFVSSLVFGMNEPPQDIETEKTDIPAAAAANGIAFPVNYQSWDVVAVSYREDNQTLRAIIGNPQAIKAIEEGKTNPWPNGVILGKLVWKERQDEHWKAAKVPAKFVHAEFMFKDTEKWAETKGWGWARWVGTEQIPFGKDESSAHASCIACHTPVKGQDWVFTKPAIMPKRIQ